MLSIVIPTYNRPKSIKSNLPIVASQMRPGVELVIIDNNSDIPVSDLINQHAGSKNHLNIKVLRNRSNIGANANILRAFEVARYPWLWILGDDDTVCKDAVDIILESIASNSNAVFLNFATEKMRFNNQRRTPFETVGLNQFIKALDFPGNINFMSVGVWNVRSVLPYLGVAYHYTYSMSYIYCLLISGLKNNGFCCFSDRVIVDNISNADSTTKWRFSDFILGWNTILELPMESQARKLLARKMYIWHVPENVCVYFLAEAAESNDKCFRYRIVVNRLAPYISGFAYLRLQIYRVFFLWPKFGWKIVSWFLRIAIAINIKGVDISDIEQRAKN
jgi:glycosyltransferase involved in cell wall biosynthesis